MGSCYSHGSINCKSHPSIRLNLDNSQAGRAQTEWDQARKSYVYVGLARVVEELCSRKREFLELERNPSEIGEISLW